MQHPICCSALYKENRMTSGSAVVWFGACLLLVWTGVLFPAYIYAAKFNEGNESIENGSNAGPDTETQVLWKNKKQIHVNIFDYMDYTEANEEHTTAETVKESSVIPPAGIAVILFVLIIITAVGSVSGYAYYKYKKEEKDKRKRQEETGQPMASPYQQSEVSPGEARFQEDLARALELDREQQEIEQEGGRYRQRQARVQVDSPADSSSSGFFVSHSDERKPRDDIQIAVDIHMPGPSSRPDPIPPPENRDSQEEPGLEVLGEPLPSNNQGDMADDGKGQSSKPDSPDPTSSAEAGSRTGEETPGSRIQPVTDVKEEETETIHHSDNAAESTDGIPNITSRNGRIQEEPDFEDDKEDKDESHDVTEEEKADEDGEIMDVRVAPMAEEEESALSDSPKEDETLL